MSTVQPTPTVVFFGEDLLDRMERAVEKVRERLERTVFALESAGIPYALSGCNATAMWIDSVDPAAVRQSRNVEILLRRSEFDAAQLAIEQTGFTKQADERGTRFIDGADGSWRSATEVTFACEPIVGKSPLFSTPDVTEVEIVNGHRIIKLDALVGLQLARFRLDDSVDLIDLRDVGLVDGSCPSRFPSEFAKRLQDLLDDPNEIALGVGSMRSNSGRDSLESIP
jgi:hypothetical protein